MNRNSRRSHSIDTLFVITLLGLFLIFLLMMLLFSTQAYRTAVEGNQENNNLYTASAYITEKFRQHDSSQSVSLDTLDNLPAFCMTDTIDGTFLCYLHLSAGSPAERTFYCKRQRPFSRNGNIHRQSGNLSGRGNIRGFLPDLHGRPAGTYHKPAASSRPACNFRMT